MDRRPLLRTAGEADRDDCVRVTASARPLELVPKAPSARRTYRWPPWGDGEARVVAEVDGRIVGLAWAGDVGGVSMADVCVARSWQRQGLGTALLAAVDRGGPCLVTNGVHGEAAIGFATANGFTASPVGADLLQVLDGPTGVAPPATAIVQVDDLRGQLARRLHELHSQGLADLPDRAEPDDYVTWLDRWTASLVAGGIVVVARREGRVVGASFEWAAAHAPAGNVSLTVVDRADRGKRVAADLKAAIAAEAGQRGRRWLTTLVDPANAAMLAVNAAAGWRTVGRCALRR